MPVGAVTIGGSAILVELAVACSVLLILEPCERGAQQTERFSLSKCERCEHTRTIERLTVPVGLSMIATFLSSMAEKTWRMRSS